MNEPPYAGRSTKNANASYALYHMNISKGNRLNQGIIYIVSGIRLTVQINLPLLGVQNRKCWGSQHDYESISPSMTCGILWVVHQGMELGG